MKKITIDDILSWEPCYHPKRYLPLDWEGTVIDILEHKEIPPQDKLWVVCREELIDEKTLRLFAVWCARQVEHLMDDERSKNALDVAERFAHGEATAEELDAARAAARAAARDAWDAARDAWDAWDAARDARDAWDAAWAARDAAASAASAASAARDARDAWDAARDARDAWDARDAAASAARDAVHAQVKRLIEMVKQ